MWQLNFKQVALIICSRCANSKNIRMKLKECVFYFELRAPQEIRTKVKKPSFWSIDEKSNIFLLKTYFFVQKYKQNLNDRFDVKWLIWSRWIYCKCVGCIKSIIHWIMASQNRLISLTNFKIIFKSCETQVWMLRFFENNQKMLQNTFLTM